MSERDAEEFVLNSRGTQARGFMTDEGLIVKAGSVARKAMVPSGEHRVLPVRERLLSEGVLIEDEDGLRFTKDHLFQSPSGAASTIMGRSANRWTEWKTKDGATLDDIKRSQMRDILHPKKRRQIIEKHRQRRARMP